MPYTEISLIGCGRIGFILENDRLRNKPCTHFGGAASAGLKITSACDLNSDRLKEFGRISDIPDDSLFTDYKILLKKRKPQLVIIATWTDTHAAIALEAIKHGAEIVILEKPAASSLQLIKKIMTEADKHNCRIIVNHERRFDGRYNKVKEIITDGVIGEIKTVNARMLTGPYRGKSFIEEGGGPLLHDGTHLVDIIRYFFGEITTVQGEFARFSRSSGFEDSASAWLQNEKDVNIFLEAGGGRKYFQFELEIWGSEGKILIGNGYNKLFLKKKSVLYSGFNDLNETKFPPIKQKNCFTELYKSAFSMLKGKTVSDISGIEDGYKALEIIHAVYYSSLLGRKKIHLPINPGVINLKKIFNLD
ncbi:MAG TPA: Gfo/Idh/MocA family oxidoreductase [Spirochaetota bacterium]|nr:Gfo/Idh/MocA family oxidoreductase [Spirochaetota bacterium]HPS86093.1 Gfo/Idh/MocA family oxidoreductase [Spirochaetota bacterium]